MKRGTTIGSVLTGNGRKTGEVRMRLINAETLKHKFAECHLEEIGLYPNNLIDNCTEIKAIPIPWMNSWANDNHSQDVRRMMKDWREFNNR